MTGQWTALVLAAGRGPDDPMARAFGVSHKCLIEVGGTPMLARVLATLRAHPAITRIAVSIEDEALVRQAIGPLPDDVFVIPSKSSAAASAAAVLESGALAHPVLLTTADHVLLDAAMLDHFFAQSSVTRPISPSASPGPRPSLPPIRKPGARSCASAPTASRAAISSA
jgi:GTP:adenosylcobinamide-phosphate guanylyltransferase